MDLDQEIIDRADRWERDNLFERQRRFDLLLQGAKVWSITGLVVGMLGAAVFGIYSCNVTDDRQDLAKASAQKECMEVLPEHTCACLADSEACQRHAAAQCEAVLGHEVCRCLSAKYECKNAAFDTCLQSLSPETCRCLQDRENCLPDE